MVYLEAASSQLRRDSPVAVEAAISQRDLLDGGAHFGRFFFGMFLDQAAVIPRPAHHGQPAPRSRISMCLELGIPKS